jgi:hypothetical protein
MRIVPTDEFRQSGSIISVTTDAILARCTSSPQPPVENRAARSIVLKKIIGWAEKNRVGRETGNSGIFFKPWYSIDN